MTDRDKFQGQFGTNQPGAPSGTKPDAKRGSLDCAAVESWLAEAAEGNLPASVAEQIREHAASCAACREKLARTRSGREWLLVLKQEPIQPPAGMIAKILAMTSLEAEGASEDSGLFSSRVARDLSGSSRPSAPLFDSDRPSSLGVVGNEARQRRSGSRKSESARADDPAASSDAATPAWQRNSVVVLRRTLLEPRLALVAAMAFFSISLTLNLLGVRLTDMRASDLRPQNVSRALTRQYAEANARVARYYENLRIVYEVESRVQQLRRAAQTSPAPQQTGGKQRKHSSNSSNDSSSDRTESHRAGMTTARQARENKHGVPQGIPEPQPILSGPRMDAAFHRNGQSLLRIDGPRSVFGESDSSHFSMYRFSKRERRLA